MRCFRVNCDVSDCQGNMYEISNESLVFQQNDLFPSAFPMMEEIRRQGKLCDVVLKVYNFNVHMLISHDFYFLD